MQVQRIRWPGLVKMATSPVPQWARELSPYHRGPTGSAVVVLVLVVLLASSWSTTERGGQLTRPTSPPSAGRTPAGQSRGSHHRW